MSLLNAAGITVSFGTLRAVDGIDLAIAGDEAVGMVGPNGSGKSTFLNALTGVVAGSGQLEIDGRGVPLGRPGAIRRAGLARAFQTPQTFVELSCVENVLLADASRTGRGLTGAWLRRRSMWHHERARWARAHAALDQVGLADRADEPAAQLSYGQQRLLELARSLVGAPRLLMLDEPSAGLNAAETEALADLLRHVHVDGLALLVVDHKIDFVESVCSRVVVLQLGRLVADGPPSEVWRDPQVVDAYLGRRHRDRRHDTSPDDERRPAQTHQAGLTHRSPPSEGNQRQIGKDASQRGKGEQREDRPASQPPDDEPQFQNRDTNLPPDEDPQVGQDQLQGPRYDHPSGEDRQSQGQPRDEGAD